MIDSLWMSVWKRFAVPALAVWTAWSVLRVCCVTAALACEFPAFLQTNSTVDGGWRDWRGMVREQHMETGLLVTVSADTMSVDFADDTTKSYVLHCIDVLPGDKKKDDDDVKFLVRRSDVAAVTSPYYTCVQFVRRSADVIQLRSTPLSDRRPDAAICHDVADAWKLDPWILIDRAAVVSRRGVPCALRGGFGVRMYDRTGHQGACDSRRGETRMEADCEHLAEGTHFYFRHATCIPVGLYMYATQRTLCTANWAIGAYTFTLLRHDRLPYAWLFRFPTKPEASFTAYLLSDLVADSAEYIAETANYIRLDMVRDVPRPATSLCLDEHDDACAAWRRPCTSGAQTAMMCARTCGVCNATRPVVCSFPSQLIGVWDGGGDKSLAVEFRRTSLAMRPTSGSRMSMLRCVRWQPAISPRAERFRYMSDDMLVAEYSDGCRPRYVCARILRKSASVMYFRLSAARTWTLTASPDDPIDCRAFSFDHVDDDDPVQVDAVRALQINHFRLLFSRESRGGGDGTPCRLPGHALNNYSVTFRNGVECLGSVSEANSPQATSLTLTLAACSSPVNRTMYSFDCSEASRLLPSKDLVVIVSSTPTASDRAVYHCWLFPVAAGLFYLFDAEQCDAVMRGAKPSVSAAGDLLPAGDRLFAAELTPLAVFSSKSRRTPREEDDPDSVASPASRVHLVPPPESPLDGPRGPIVPVYSNTSAPTTSSSPSPSVRGADRASLTSNTLVATSCSAVVLTIVHYVHKS